MKDLDQILFDALKGDAALMEAVGGRVVSTCFEVGPDEMDNTPLPCIIVTDDGWQNQQESKDTMWESMEDRVTASIEVDADSPKAVKQLMRLCRKAVARYIDGMAEAGDDIPELDSVQASQLAWDWMKPCYWRTITYNCLIENEYE